MAWIPLLALQAACLLAGNVISVTLRTRYSRYKEAISTQQLAISQRIIPSA
jgi:hypothetical protein